MAVPPGFPDDAVAARRALPIVATRAQQLLATARAGAEIVARIVDLLGRPVAAEPAQDVHPATSLSCIASPSPSAKAASCRSSSSPLVRAISGFQISKRPPAPITSAASPIRVR